VPDPAPAAPQPGATDSLPDAHAAGHPEEDTSARPAVDPKPIAPLLARRPQLGRDVFPRGWTEASEAGRGSDLTDLLRACLVLLHVPEAQAAAYRPLPPPLWRVTDALPHIRRLLAGSPGGGPLPAFLPPIKGDDPDQPLRCRAAVASTLVAGLELARDGAVDLAQEPAWTDIRVSRRDDHDARPVETAGLAGSAPQV
jgi:chromatin segregation and condensation protein Rec8/ScpA/Scc1 (kleisin family)